jgi:hypothetical protein
MFLRLQRREDAEAVVVLLAAAHHSHGDGQADGRPAFSHPHIICKLYHRVVAVKSLEFSLADAELAQDRVEQKQRDGDEGGIGDQIRTLSGFVVGGGIYIMKRESNSGKKKVTLILEI